MVILKKFCTEFMILLLMVAITLLSTIYCLVIFNFP